MAELQPKFVERRRNVNVQVLNQRDSVPETAADQREDIFKDETLS
jgi:hypothetical protein